MPKKATRYQGEHKERITVSLTATAVEKLDELAASQGISRSELIERIGRGRLVISLDAGQVGECLAS